MVFNGLRFLYLMVGGKTVFTAYFTACLFEDVSHEMKVVKYYTAHFTAKPLNTIKSKIHQPLNQIMKPLNQQHTYENH